MRIFTLLENVNAVQCSGGRFAGLKVRSACCGTDLSKVMRSLSVTDAKQSVREAKLHYSVRGVRRSKRAADLTGIQLICFVKGCQVIPSGHNLCET